MEYSSAKVCAPSLLVFFCALLYFRLMAALVSSTQVTELSDIITPETLGSKRRIHTVLLIALFAVEAMIFYVHVARDIAPFYPSNFDQLSYYLATYDLISAFHARGRSVIVEELFHPKSPTATIFF